jgi:WD40 repeat protein/tRNA A-37 threonylcarbamoyl transferase component Bud32
MQSWGDVRMNQPTPERDEQKTIAQWHGAILPDVLPVEEGTHAGPPPEQSLAPLSRIADYELLREVGRGGMGVVFKARHVRLNRVVALKMIRGGALADAEDVQRFAKEAEAAAQLQHPNIVALYEVGSHEEQPYLSMEYISGSSLAERAAQGPLPGRRAAVYLEATARAVQCAHSRGVLHRDLKPANVLLDENDQPKVTDFGLAKLMSTDSGQTRTGAVLGTPSYMSPEQAAGRKDLGPPSDVYSLGAILYELLTGTPPFRGETALATLNLVADQEPITPRLLNPTLDRELETICLKCLEKDPGRRYASADALAQDLRRYLDGEPIAARRLSAPGRAVRWCRRNPAWALLGCLSAAALLAFVLVVWQTAREEKDLREQAQESSRLAQLRLDTMRHLLYMAEVRQAQHALEHADFGRAEKLLERWRPREGMRDLRGWEWYFLRQQCQGRFALGTHAGHAWAVAYRPDGRQLASAGGEYQRPGEIKVWDPRTGRLLHTLTGHRDRVAALAYHPTKNLLASAGYDRTVRLWDLDQGRELLVLVGHSAHVNSVAYSAAGDLLASASGDGTVRLWDVAAYTADPSRGVRVLQAHEGEVTAVAFQPEGTLLASAGHDRVVKLWDPATASAVKVLSGHEGPIECLAFSPGGKVLASGGGAGNRRGEVKLWDVVAGRAASSRYGLSDRVLSLAFSRTNKLAAAGGDGIIRIWDQTVTSEPLTLRGDTQWVHGLAFSPDGYTLASAGRSGRISVWNSSGGLESLTLAAPGIQEAVAFNPVGRFLAAAGRAGNGELRVWNLDYPERPVVLRGHRGNVTCLVFTPDGTHLASGGEDGTVRLHDFRDPERPALVLPAQGSRVLALAFSPDGHLLAVAGDDTPIRLYDPATGALVKVLDGHGNSVLALAFSPDGRRLASGGYDRSVRLWDLQAGQDHYTLTGHTGAVHALAFSPDGQLATAGSDMTIRVWDLLRRHESFRLEGSPAAILSLAFHPQSRRLVSAGQDRMVRVWDVVTRQELLELEENLGAIRGIAFSADGRYLAGAGNGVVRVWDASEREMAAR